MLRNILKIAGVTSLLITPTYGQFGVGKRNQGGGTFQERNEQARAGASSGSATDMISELGNLDQSDLMDMIRESMNDPATLEYLEQLGQGMDDVMKQLASMDPEQMKDQITQNLAAVSSKETLDLVLEQKDEVLESLLLQGLITEEQMIEYQNDPEAYQRQMTEAFEEMGKILADPAALDAAMEMMSGMADIMKNPDEAMARLAEAFNAELGDDDKIEEARMQLLADPSAAGNPALASLFENDDMLELLQDPKKWREQVKRGQKMMAGAGVGEL